MLCGIICINNCIIKCIIYDDDNASTKIKLNQMKHCRECVKQSLQPLKFFKFYPHLEKIII